MTSDKDNWDDGINAGTIGADIVATVVGAIVPPVGVGLGVAAGGVQLAHQWSKRRQRRANLVDEGLSEILGPAVDAARERVEQDEDLAALVAQALDASMLSHHEEQARALGRVIGEAVRSGSDLTIDRASLIIETLRGMDLPHFKVLQNARAGGKRPERMKLLAEAVGADETTTEAIVSTLLMRGLILDYEGVSFFPTQFGHVILRYIS